MRPRWWPTGPTIIDVGGESTRPGASAVSESDELARVIPVIEAVHAAHPDAAISIDTAKASVARSAVSAGACIINDVTAAEGDPGMTAAMVESRAGVVLMHMQGSPRTMQKRPTYTDAVAEVGAYLSGRVETLRGRRAASQPYRTGSGHRLRQGARPQPCS